MALTVGDVVYRIGADTSRLRKASSELTKFKKQLDKVASSANKLKSSLGKGITIRIKFAQVSQATRAIDKLAASAYNAQSILQDLGKAAKGTKSINVNVKTSKITDAIRRLKNLENTIDRIKAKSKDLSISISSSVKDVANSYKNASMQAEAMSARSARAFALQERQASSLLRQILNIEAKARLQGIDIVKADQFKSAKSAIFELNEALKQGALKTEEFNKRLINAQNYLASANREFRRAAQSQRLIAKAELEKGAAAAKIDDLKRQLAYLQASPKLIQKADEAYQQLANSLDRIAKKGKASAGEIAAAKAQFSRAFTSLRNEAKSLEKGLTRTTVVLGNFIQGIKSVGTAYAAFLVFQGIESAVSGLFEASDAMKLLRTRIKQVSRDINEFEGAWKAVFDIANRTRTDLDAVGKLYTRIAAATKPLGRSQEEILKVTETVTAALLAGGASAQEAASATLQLSQAFAKGKLDGDELRSVLENAQVLTAAMGRQFGITAGDAKSMTGVIIEMARRGELTIDKFFDAILASHQEMTKLIADTPLTMGQAWQLLKNELAKVVDQFQRTVDWSGTLSKVIKTLAMNVEKLTVVFAGLFGVLSARSVLKRAPSTFRDIKETFSKLLGFIKSFKGIFSVVIGLLSAAGAAWALYRDKVVTTIGETKVTIQDYANAIWSLLGDYAGSAIKWFSGLWDSLSNFIKKFSKNTKEDLKKFSDFISNSWVGKIANALKQTLVGSIKFMVNSWIRGFKILRAVLERTFKFIKSLSRGKLDVSFFADLGDVIKNELKTDYVEEFSKKSRKAFDKAANAVKNLSSSIRNDLNKRALKEARDRIKRIEEEGGFGGLTKAPPARKGISEEQKKQIENLVQSYRKALSDIRLEFEAFENIPIGSFSKQLQEAFGTEWTSKYIQAFKDIRSQYEGLTEETWPEFKKQLGLAQETLEEFLDDQVKSRLILDGWSESIRRASDAASAFKDAMKELSEEQRRVDALLSGGISAARDIEYRIRAEQSIPKDFDIGEFNRRMEAQGLSPVGSRSEAVSRMEDIIRKSDKLREFNEIFRELTPEVDRVNEQFDRWKKIILEVASSNEQLREKMLNSLEEMRNKALEAIDPMRQLAREIGDSIGSAFEDLIVEGKKFSDVLKQLEKDILRLVTRKLVTEPLSNAISGFVQGVFSGGGFNLGNLFKFAHGGQFKVSGAGGTDSQLVAFWATPGETVTVTPRGREVSDQRMASSDNINVVINISTPTGTVDPQSLGQIQAALARAVQRGGRNL